MAIMKCSACEANESITFCSETGLPLCAVCAIPCDVCEIPITLKRAQITTTGRRLCAKCMAGRNARRRAKREKMRQKGMPEKKVAVAPPPPQPTTAPKAAGGVAGALGPTSFEALYSGSDLDAEPAPPPAIVGSVKPQQPPGDGSTSFEDLYSRSDLDAAPAGPAFGEAEPGTDEDGQTKRSHGLEGVPTDASGRLELPPIDENRPVLTSSGYQAPSKTAYALAFIFFGVAGAIFFSTTPILKDIMFPFDTPEFRFNAGQDTPITDTNALRDTSNISQLNLFSQTPIFFATWLILIVYVGGSIWLMTSVLLSVISSYRAKRRLRKIEKKYGGHDPFSSLG